MPSLIKFPTTSMVDKDGRLSREWQLWLQNPQFLTVTTTGFTTSVVPTNGQTLIGSGGVFIGGNITGTGITVSNGAGTIGLSLSNTGVTAATYGSATQMVSFSINAQGQITSAVNAGSLGTMSTQAASSVAITGGSATNITLAPIQAPTASAPAYQKGYMYFDTTLNKLRIGGASAWETVTSV